MSEPLDTEAGVRAWLMDYAWMGTPEERAANVDCIMHQDGWRYVDALTERFAGQAENPGPEAYGEAQGMALSALYECHDGPHLPTCPATRRGTSG